MTKVVGKKTNQCQHQASVAAGARTKQVPEQGGSFVDLLFIKSPTETSLKISVCTAAICLLFTNKTLTLTISLKPWSVSRNRYSSVDCACFFNLAKEQKEEGRQKYIISLKKEKGITGKGSSFIHIYYTPKRLSYQGPLKATSENRKTGLTQEEDLVTLLCNRELLNWPDFRNLSLPSFLQWPKRG